MDVSNSRRSREIDAYFITNSGNRIKRRVPNYLQMSPRFTA
jgi:hypothetical protein